MARSRDVDASFGSLPVRVGVLGCGNVGSALIELVDREAAQIAERSGVHLEITKVAVRDLDRQRAVLGLADRLTDDPQSIVQSRDIDIVVELIGGIEPAQRLIEEALLAGKSVVSANKELLATRGAHLQAIAAKAGRDLLYEAAVEGAVPLLRVLSVSLAGERVRRVMGIMNGTTNYILTEMADAHVSYETALAAAVQHGYAESDPSYDVEGFDAAAKCAIVASIAFRADVAAGDVFRQGISDITVADIEFAQRRGYVIKLLSIAELVLVDGTERVAVRVHPALVPVEHPLAGVRGSFNAAFIEGEHAGELMLYGRGAGGQPTASAVLGDVLDAARGLQRATNFEHPFRRSVAIATIDELRSQYYVTLEVIDQPGVMAQVAATFGDHQVSIRSMEQVGLAAEARMVFITHMAREADVQATLADLGQLESVERIGGLLRVIGTDDVEV